MAVSLGVQTRVRCGAGRGCGGRLRRVAYASGAREKQVQQPLGNLIFGHDGMLAQQGGTHGHDFGADVRRERGWTVLAQPELGPGDLREIVATLARKPCGARTEDAASEGVAADRAKAVARILHAFKDSIGKRGLVHPGDSEKALAVHGDGRRDADRDGADVRRCPVDGHAMVVEDPSVLAGALDRPVEGGAVDRLQVVPMLVPDLGFLVEHGRVGSDGAALHLKVGERDAARDVLGHDLSSHPQAEV
jgi:hypothetical protein